MELLYYRPAPILLGGQAADEASRSVSLCDRDGNHLISSGRVLVQLLLTRVAESIENILQ